MIIKSNLRHIAEERGLSIRQIARDIDYRFDSVRQLYNDEMERYPRDLLTKLCNYLEISVSELLVMDKDSTEEQ